MHSQQAGDEGGKQVLCSKGSGATGPKQAAALTAHLYHLFHRNTPEMATHEDRDREYVSHLEYWSIGSKMRKGGGGDGEEEADQI